MKSFPERFDLAHTGPAGTVPYTNARAIHTPGHFAPGVQRRDFLRVNPVRIHGGPGIGR